MSTIIPVSSHKPFADVPAIKRDEISIQIATRGRPEMLAQVFESLKVNTQRKDKTVLWVYVDEDDRLTQEAVKTGKLPETGFPVHWHIGTQTPSLGETHEILWKDSGRASGIYMVSVDDARFDTPGWDEVVRKGFAEYPDGVLLGFPHDPMSAHISTYPIFGWRWLELLQRFFSGYFPFWYEDKWVHQVGRLAQRCIKLPIVLYPIRGKGRTRRMRNLPFWTRFYQLMLEERKEWAKTLIAGLHQENPEIRAAAAGAMDAIASNLLTEEGPFSDLYTVFQEERHTDLTPAQRQGFDPRHFQQEALAVGRLLAMAQSLLIKGRYAEAMEFLDATRLSDLHARQASILKAKCLSGLGRETEAARLQRAQFGAWPKPGAASRVLSLSRVVANDAKRLLAGLSAKGKRGT